MVRFIFVLGVLFFSNTAYSQTFIERIYLKDSSFHEGYIIEQVPTQHLKIDRLAQKDTITVPFSQIWKITKTYDLKKDSVFKKPEVAPNNKYIKMAYLELFGNAGIYSLNFDMRTQKGRRDGWGLRVGIEYLKVDLTDTLTGDELKASLLAIPFGINYVFGKKKGALEVGAGATYIFLNYNGQYNWSEGGGDAVMFYKDVFGDKINTLIGTFNVAYRRTPYKKGFAYRIAFCPLVVTGVVVPSFGFSFGYKF
jgi:hypothetical protein